MKIAIIIPYFGKFPECFPVWLKSCELNKEVNFLIFTDDCTKYNYPDNVIVNITTFDDVKKRIRKTLGFAAVLEKPYKLCDYKPTYGEVFSDYLKGYDFWGFCDVDLIFGKISDFITDEMLKKYDRIYTRGHFSIFKNNTEVNAYYRTLQADRCQNYKTVFLNPKTCAFDEWAGVDNGGLSLIMQRTGKPMYDEPDMADLDFGHGNFKINRRNNDKVKMFEFSQDGLYGIAEGGSRIPFLYVHFQKRKVYCNKVNLDNKFYILPPSYLINNVKEQRLRRKISIVVHKLRYIQFRAGNLKRKIKAIIKRTD